MKRIYIATYKHGLKGPTRVVAESENEAIKAAYIAYTFTSTPVYPWPSISDVVENVVLSSCQFIGGNGIQPCVQVDCARLTSKDVLTRIFV